MKLTKKIFFTFIIFLFQINQNIICCIRNYNDKEEVKAESDDDSYDSEIKKGTIFMLVGTSSCGKTTILKQLKCIKFDSKVSFFEPDNIRNSSIKKHNNTRSLEEDISKLSPFSSPKFDHNKFSKSYDNLECLEDETYKLEPEHEITITKVKKIADRGINVIFDAILLNRQSPPDDIYKEVANKFKKYNLYIILVYCPIDLLYENTKKRNIIAALRQSSKDSRNIFLALKQFPMIYTKAKTKSLRIIDKISIEKVLQLSTQIAPKDDIENCFLLSLFKEKFGLCAENSQILIKPIHHYDFIFKNENLKNEKQFLHIEGLVNFIKEKIN